MGDIIYQKFFCLIYLGLLRIIRIYIRRYGQYLFYPLIFYLIYSISII